MNNLKNNISLYFPFKGGNTEQYPAFGDITVKDRKDHIKIQNYTTARLDEHKMKLIRNSRKLNEINR